MYICIYIDKYSYIDTQIYIPDLHLKPSPCNKSIYGAVRVYLCMQGLVCDVPARMLSDEAL
jgi:hypothetical protein